MAHEKYRLSLASKSQGRGIILVKSWKYLPLLLRPVSKLTWLRFAAQFYQLFLDIDSKFDKLSSSLLGQIS